VVENVRQRKNDGDGDLACIPRRACAFHSGDGDAAPARPSVSRHGRVHVVTVSGTIDARTIDRLELALGELASRPRQPVVLVLNASGGVCGPPLNATCSRIKMLGESRPVIAHVVRAEGIGAFQLSTSTRGIFAAPTARIGRWSIRKVDDGDPRTVAQIQHAAIEQFRAARPSLGWSTICRLTTGAVDGEMAEAMGVVDLLVRGVDDLIPMFQGCAAAK
jgi:membrane-bound ClpP family serine protease